MLYTNLESLIYDFGIIERTGSAMKVVKNIIDLLLSRNSSEQNCHI
jgi:hypothetical protein